VQRSIARELLPEYVADGKDDVSLPQFREKPACDNGICTLTSDVSRIANDSNVQATERSRSSLFPETDNVVGTAVAMWWESSKA